MRYCFILLSTIGKRKAKHYPEMIQAEGAQQENKMQDLLA
jgi:hypothetical protein